MATLNFPMLASAPPLSVAVIGSGPAGLMAAEALSMVGHPVAVYDRMPSAGRKLLMAGRGGLNLTHTEDLDDFIARYAGAAPYLKPFIEAFRPEALRAWCEALDQRTFVGSSGRVFPEALKASPLLRAWLRRLDHLGVRFAFHHRWEGWDEAGCLRFTSPHGPIVTRPAATILALGGASWPRLGSDGAWIETLAAHGTQVTPLKPSNMGFKIAWSEFFRPRFEGKPLKRIALAFGGVTVRGEAMITAEGIEGGAIYAHSASLRDAIAADGSARLLVDLRPDLTLDALAGRLAAPRNGRSTSTILRKAAGLPPIAVGLLREGADGALPTDPARLAALIKAVPLTLSGVPSIDRAISTAGGVSFNAVDGNLMLRHRPGVFAAGEMLDWEAPTGGYLLQAVFATGLAAAQGVLRWLSTKQSSQA